MRVYVDTSALIKRVIVERESTDLEDALEEYADRHVLLASSTLAWVEVGRAVRSRYDASYGDVADEVSAALAGIAEHRMDREVISLSRRLPPNALRSLDAIHLASAVLLDVEVMVTYDRRLAEAAALAGIRCTAPGDGE
ncbi:hypothetical protein SAMN05421810_105292 [Amycolatopsis arida]|uniref:Ribonuclease VapC n=1 Tax=Amycolatopsis arida TaxID=587909 RepID=A0A1I5WVN0_9PSEU|nr:type II toxin-antitoxin system VapC family toxin [Amycolatopsis arida]TDX92466.1 hypothetical protein CLV69_105311 [Amycolatopsis arida]SFQ23566.1 hypothetical protein SAMN05421810_105292 [Amycolatopsis arida]